MTIHSNNLFAPVYGSYFRMILNHEKERYTFVGGRASAKSSFISIVIVVLIVMFPKLNALIVRKTAKSLRHSVFAQIVWAIDLLHLRYTEQRGSGFKIPKSGQSALPISYLRRSGELQQVIFTGCDDPEKLKSIKATHGYFGILWAEEKNELTQSELQNVRISALRGGDRFYIFESYNPPSATRHWCNREAATYDANRVIINTTYRDIPAEWVGPAIMHDIELLKISNPRAYENIYLGKATGTGRNVFENVELREISEVEISAFDYVYRGIDWGYYPDPLAYSAMSYNAAKKTLYIFDELYLKKRANYEAFTAIAEHMKALKMDIANDRITADSSEPKSIADFRSWGGNVRGAIKGIGSRDASFKWLQGLRKIVIDPVRCPKISDEFALYEYEIDKRTGEVLSGYPDGQPDHGIDTVRYALESVWRHRGE